MLTFIFTIYLKVRQEITVAWETAQFNLAPHAFPDGLCGIGHAYDDHDEEDRGVVDEFDDDEGGSWVILMDEDDDDE